MRVIDRYLLWQFTQVFLICFISLAGLYTVIDAFGRLDDFGGEGKSLGESVVAAGKYYGLQSINFFNQTSGILAMIAAMFTVTWIQRHNEMTALLAAGLPRWRILSPVLIAAILVAIMATGIREWVIPTMRYELSLDSEDLEGDKGIDLKPRYDNVSDILLGGDKAVLKTSTILRPSFVMPPRFIPIYGKQLTADTAQYLEASGERPAGYLLTGVSQPLSVDSKPMLKTSDDMGVVVSRTDAAWLEPNSVFVASGVSFEILASGSQWRDLASTPELIHELASPSTELGPDVRVAVHSRLLQPFLDITLLMLGLPLVVSRGGGNPFVALGLGVLVVTCFFLVTLGGQALGSGGWITPALAAWLPLLAFVPIATAQSESLRQ